MTLTDTLKRSVGVYVKSPLNPACLALPAEAQPSPAFEAIIFYFISLSLLYPPLPSAEGDNARFVKSVDAPFGFHFASFETSMPPTLTVLPKLS